MADTAAAAATDAPLPTVSLLRTGLVLLFVSQLDVVG